MRTTVDIPDELRAQLLALAARRGLRGYSELVREAIAYYLEKELRREEGAKEVLKLAGSWSAEDAAAFRERVEELWKRWPR